MARIRPERWAAQEWNTPIGRVIWWMGRGNAGSKVARATARAFYTELANEIGPERMRRLLVERGIAELLAWLTEGSKTPGV